MARASRQADIRRIGGMSGQVLRKTASIKRPRSTALRPLFGLLADGAQ
jgi:hypothetical protein